MISLAELHSLAALVIGIQIGRHLLKPAGNMK